MSAAADLPGPGWYGASAAARLLGVSVDTVRNWGRSGKLRAHRTDIGTLYYVEALTGDTPDK